MSNNFDINKQQSTTQPQKQLIVEYIDEAELGPNYQDNYIVYLDEKTNENYIIDFSQKYKYIIRKGNNNNNNNNSAKSQPQQQVTTKNITSQDIDSDDQQQQQQRFIYGYVDESELNLIDLTKLTILKNDLLDEYYIKDPLKSNKFWIILPHKWNENEELPYVLESDVDFMNWIIHLEQNTNRKYIIDERDNTPYYIIPDDYMKEFKEEWYKFYKSYKINEASSSENKLPEKNNRDMIIEYVDEDELKTIDLFNVKIQKDQSYGEYYIQDPTNINRRWIVLPSNWFNNNKSQLMSNNKQHYYVFEDEVNNKINTIFKDAQKRRYIVDKKTNMKLYLVPRVTDHRQSFKYKWSQINQNLKNTKYKENNKLSMSKVVQTSSDKNEVKKTRSPVEIVDLPGSPRPLHYLMIEQNRFDKTNKRNQKSSTNEHISRQRSMSNEVVDRAYDKNIRTLSPQVNRQRILDAQVHGQHRSNSSDNVLNDQARSNSGRVKKSVYFNENVKVSDGTTPTIAPLAVPLKYEKHFANGDRNKFEDNGMMPPQQQQQPPPPPIKPREIKPMVEFIDNNNNNNTAYKTANIPFNYTNNSQINNFQNHAYNNNNNNNSRIQQSGEVIRIKQHGRPGHVIHTNRN